MCVAPLLPLFHHLSRRGSWLIDVVTVAVLLAVAATMWGHLWIEYWFAFYLGMIVQTRGHAWARFASERIGLGPAVVISYAVMALPAMLFTDRPCYVAMLETAGAFSLVSLIVWGDGSAMSRVLNHPLLRWNGRLSYSFYLWHYFILTMAVRLLYLVFTPGLLHRDEVAVCVLTAALTVGLALAVAQVSYSFIERPFIELGRRLAAQWQQRARAHADTIVDLAAP